jgi:hypothetical protein
MVRNVERLIEPLRGRGWLYVDSDRLGPADYRIDRWQTFHVIEKPAFGTGPSEEHPGPQRLAIHIVTEIDTSRLATSHTRLTLHLQDGQLLDLFFDGNKFVADGSLRRDE